MAFLFEYGRLSFEEVRDFLYETDREFPTPLSLNTDVVAYAKKLSDYADFSICRDDGTVIGMISCYTNNPPTGFISNVCVKTAYQGKKIFSRMYEVLLNEISTKGITILRLDVEEKNTRGIAIYNQYGFIRCKKQDIHGKIRLEKTL